MVEISHTLLVLIVALLGVYFVFIYLGWSKVDKLREDVDCIMAEEPRMSACVDAHPEVGVRPGWVHLVKVPMGLGSDYYEHIRGEVMKRRVVVDDHPWDIEVVRAEDDHPNGIDITLL